MCRVDKPSLLDERFDHCGVCGDDDCQHQKDRTADLSPVKRLRDVTWSHSDLKPPKQLFDARIEMRTIYQTTNTTIDPIFKRPSTAMMNNEEEMTNKDIVEWIKRLCDIFNARFDRIEDRLDRIEMSSEQSYAKRFTVRLDAKDLENEGRFVPFGYGMLLWKDVTDDPANPEIEYSILTCGHVGVKFHSSEVKTMQLVFVGATPKKTITCEREDSLFLTKQYVDSNITDLCIMKLESGSVPVEGEIGYSMESIEWESPDDIRGVDVYGKSSVRIKANAVVVDPLEDARFLLGVTAVPGSSGTALFRNGRLVGFVKGILNREDHTGEGVESIMGRQAYTYVYADGKEDTGILTFHQVGTGQIGELVKYIEWRGRLGVANGASPPSSRAKRVVRGLRQRCHRRFWKTSKDPSDKFLLDSKTVTVGTVNCVSWTDETTRAANLAAASLRNDLRFAEVTVPPTRRRHSL